jgi:hypothetical protein
MNQSIPFTDQVRNVFRPSPRGVVGLVDDLFELCLIHQLRLRFENDHCSIRRLGANDDDVLLVSVPKSVFRAVLARVAAICNDQNPRSVTPYDGEAEIVHPVQPIAVNGFRPASCFVSFTNTPSEHHLEMRFSRSAAVEGSRFTVLLRDQRIVTVYGHQLQYQTDSGSYGILACGADGDLLVALFPAGEVIGVFRGDIRDAPGNVPAAVGTNTAPVPTGREAQRHEAANASSWPI